MQTMQTMRGGRLVCVDGISKWAQTMWTYEAFKAEGYIRRPRRCGAKRGEDI